MFSRPHAARTLFRSLLAGFACALVLGLGLLAHSPAAHAWLHSTGSACEHPRDADHAHRDDAAPGSDAASAEHHCAVTAFAQGADSPAPASLVVAPLSVSAVALLPESEIRLARTEHLRPPGRAPPAA